MSRRANLSSSLGAALGISQSDFLQFDVQQREQHAGEGQTTGDNQPFVGPVSFDEEAAQQQESMGAMIDFSALVQGGSDGNFFDAVGPGAGTGDPDLDSLANEAEQPELIRRWNTLGARAQDQAVDRAVAQMQSLRRGPFGLDPRSSCERVNYEPSGGSGDLTTDCVTAAVGRVTGNCHAAICDQALLGVSAATGVPVDVLRIEMREAMLDAQQQQSGAGLNETAMEEAGGQQSNTEGQQQQQGQGSPGGGPGPRQRRCFDTAGRQVGCPPGIPTGATVCMDAMGEPFACDPGAGADTDPGGGDMTAGGAEPTFLEAASPALIIGGIGLIAFIAARAVRR